jgi:hypothetical protein
MLVKLKLIVEEKDFKAFVRFEFDNRAGTTRKPTTVNATKSLTDRLSESINERFTNESDWHKFLKENEIEIVDQNDLVQIANDKNNYVWADPKNPSRFLKLSEDFVEKFAGNPYFDKRVTEDMLNNILNSLNEDESSLVEEIENWHGTTKSVTVLLPVEVKCNWECDYDDINVDDCSVEVTEDDFKEEAIKQCEEKIQKYKNLVKKLATKFKVDKEELRFNLVGIFPDGL